MKTIKHAGRTFSVDGLVSDLLAGRREQVVARVGEENCRKLEAKASAKVRDDAAVADRKQSVRLSFWDKTGARRVYVSGGRFLEGRDKVWFEENGDGGWIAKGHGNFLLVGSTLNNQSKADVVATDALAILGLAEDCSFDDLISFANRGGRK